MFIHAVQTGREMWPPNCIEHVRSFRLREWRKQQRNHTALLAGPRFVGIFLLPMMQLELRKSHVEVLRVPCSYLIPNMADK